MDYYLREAGAQIATAFYDEFIRCRQIIAEHPESYPLTRKGIRRINFRRFPFHILYQVVDEDFVKILVSNMTAAIPTSDLIDK